MAILGKYLVASSLFSIAALAAPLVQRDTVTDIVMETVWTTVDVTTTIYDDAVTATTTTSAMQMTTDSTSTSNPITLVPMTTSTDAAATSPTPAAQFFTTSAISAAPAVASFPGHVTTTPTTTPTLAFAPAATVPSSAPSGQPPSAGSKTGTCEGQNNACVGDVTHWDGGLGACGTEVDTNNDLAIALPFQFMGTLSNNNPYCGRSVTLYNPRSGTTVQAIARDKCMGCYDRSIDCTNILFNKITANQGDGRMSGIEWWFN